MTRDQFIELHRHHYLGLVADAIGQQRSGDKLGLFLLMATQKIETRLGQIFDQLQPKPGPQGPQPGGTK